MNLKEVPFGGLQQREADERVPFEYAIRASDCELDEDTVKGRSAYRSILTALATVGASGTPQAMARFRPSLTSAKTVVVVGGSVYVVTDPTTETASDGAASLVSAGAFGTTDLISMAQLGRYMYIGSDNASKPMQRMDSAYTLQTLETISQGIKPVLQAFNNLAFTLFKDLSAPTAVACVFGTSGIPAGASTWRSVTLTGANDDPLTGATCLFNLGANFDASAYDWLVIGITPNSTNNTNGQVDVQLARDSAGPTDITTSGSIYDVPPIGGSPNLLYCDLRGLPSAVRSSVRYIKFVLSGASGGKFGVYGYLFLPSKPLANPQNYYVEFANPATGQKSPLTEALEVTIRDVDVVLPLYPDCYVTSGNFATTSSSLDLLSNANRRIWNREAAKSMPSSKSDIGAVVTVRETLPANVIAGYEARLYKDTNEGRRLVYVKTLTGGDIAATFVDLVDNGGQKTLSNSKFKAGGTPPRMTALASRAGRLIAGYENTVYVSSFTPPGAISDPFPQFPAIAVEDADGYSFDIAPTKAEGVQCIVDGDVLYVGTNERVCSLNDLTAPTDGLPPPFYAFSRRGVIGRRAMTYADGEDGSGFLIWASANGLHAAQNRAIGKRLTETNTRLYRSWLLPDTSLVLGYQDSKLFAFRGTRYIRFDFLQPRWTQGTLAHTVSQVACWSEPTTGKEEMWMLMSDRFLGRWQAGVQRDLQIGTDTATGTAIADWVYSTGFVIPGQSTRVENLYVDCSGGSVSVMAAKTTDDDLARKISFTPGRAVKPLKGDLAGQTWRLELSGKNATTLKVLMIDFFSVDKTGA